MEVLKTVEAIAEELNTAPINVAVAWVLSRPNIVTAAIGSRKPEQIKQFCRAGNLELSPEHLSRLTAASDAFHTHKS
jgi:aryl-alcohol dehydrogenase-like predicted oxidoreductase